MTPTPCGNRRVPFAEDKEAMQKFRLKQPVEAMVWDGPQDNATLQKFCDGWASVADSAFPYVTTRDGATELKPGDWIVKGVVSAFAVVSHAAFMHYFESVSVPCDSCGKDIPDGEGLVVGGRDDLLFCSGGCVESHLKAVHEPVES